jgi:hypothetical protein
MREKRLRVSMMIIVDVLVKGRAKHEVIFVVEGIEIGNVGGIRPIHGWDMKLRLRRRGS